MCEFVVMREEEVVVREVVVREVVVTREENPEEVFVA
jgi:hypothetical protein